MSKWIEASDKIEALLKSIADISNYEDKARQSGYTCGYLSMMLIDMYSKSQTVRDIVDARMAGMAKETA